MTDEQKSNQSSRGIGIPEIQRVVGQICNERIRQIEAEGFSAEHDDEYTDGELVRAACCYATYAQDEGHQRAAFRYAEAGRAPAGWRWPARWWKPKSRRRDLVRAAALLIAEIQRLDREQEKG